MERRDGVEWHTDTALNDSESQSKNYSTADP